MVEGGIDADQRTGYAITWYGIACALIGVYLAFHFQAGRLTIGAWGRDPEA